MEKDRVTGNTTGNSKITFHYQQIGKLAELDILNPDFYDNICLGKPTKEIVLKKLIIWFFYGFDDLDDRGNSDDLDFYECLDFIQATKEKKIEINGTEYDIIDDFADIFRELFIWGFGFDLYCQVSEQTDECVKVCVDFVNNEMSTDIKVKMLYLLFQDSNIIGCAVVNHVLKLFNHFCKSLLKGEYVIEDEFSEKLLNDLEKKFQTQKFQRALSSVLERDKGIEDEVGVSNVIEKIRSILTQKSKWLKEEQGDKDSIIASFFNKWGDDDTPYVSYYSDFLDISREYFIFNRRIDTFIESSEHPTRIQNYFDAEEKYRKRYDKAIVKFFNAGSWRGADSNLLEISKMFPYLFRKMLDMSIIDHNFIFSGNNFKELLSLDELLGDPKQAEKGFLRVLVELEELNGISKDVLAELYKTLQLVRYKNSVLIYKILNRKKAPHFQGKANDYEYIGNGQVILFSETGVTTRSFQVPKKPEDYKYVKEDAVFTEYNVYKERERNSTLRSYENIYLGILQENDDYVDCLRKYKELEKEIKRKVGIIHSSEQIKNRDITNYNQAIYRNLKEHFVKYGYWIKRLQIEVKNRPDEQYLKETMEFLQNNDKDDVLSCSFIRKHLDWALNCLQEKIETTNPADKSGFDYMKLTQQLLSCFERLIRYIKKDYYCLNFSSLFQDCFYSYSFQPSRDENCCIQNLELLEVVRCPEITSMNELENSIINKSVVFISSAWQPTIDISRLEKECTYFSEKSRVLMTDFNNNYYKRVLEEQVGQKIEKVLSESNKQVKEELDDNKRTMVQVLGIFATFLALATVFVGTLRAAEGLKDHLKVMSSITICLCVFVVLLHFVVGRKHNHPAMNLICLALIAFFVLLLGAFILIP